MNANLATGIFETIWTSNPLWTIIGFLVGFFASLLLERWSRFRATLDSACQIIWRYDAEMRSTSTALEVSTLADYLFEGVLFELTIQGQFRARDELRDIRNEIGRITQVAIATVNALPANDTLLQHFKGNRVPVIQTHLGFAMNENRDRLVTKALSVKPELIVSIGGYFSATRFKKIIDYIDGKRGDWK
jgi:hypothetical protein